MSGWLADTRILYCGLVGLVAVERLAELAISRRHSRRLLGRGGIETGAEHHSWMVALHTGFLVSCPAEVLFLERPWIRPLGLAMASLLLGTMALRYWVVRTLGERWSTRVITLPGAPLVASGPYRWLRHPNYVAVAVELAALPLVHTAWISAIVFGVLNAFLLRRRIRVEDRALRSARRHEAGATA